MLHSESAHHFGRSNTAGPLPSHSAFPLLDHRILSSRFTAQSPASQSLVVLGERYLMAPREGPKRPRSARG
jgi:hypothetical protein